MSEGWISYVFCFLNLHVHVSEGKTILQFRVFTYMLTPLCQSPNLSLITIDHTFLEHTQFLIKIITTPLLLTSHTFPSLTWSGLRSTSASSSSSLPGTTGGLFWSSRGTTMLSSEPPSLPRLMAAASTSEGREEDEIDPYHVVCTCCGTLSCISTRAPPPTLNDTGSEQLN